MTPTLPAYYHSLAPFREVFATGLPILTYHKLGPRPAGVRLKGLYVSQSLFDRQLGEFRKAGYQSVPPPDALQPASVAGGRIVLTFDDGFRNVLRHGLPVLERYGFRAIQFLVADLIGRSNEWEQREGEAAEPLMDASEVRQWLAAGHRIGGHSRSHPHLTQLSWEAAREEIAGCRKRLEDQFGIAVDDFCYPYGDWNEAIADLVREAGYRTACTTMAGVNTPGDSPFGLKRFTARYPSRNFKSIWQNLRAHWATSSP